MPELPRYTERVSMERNRDLRDYALIAGFSGRQNYIDYLVDRIPRGGRFLDMGCGRGKAVHQAALELHKRGIRTYALDRVLPEKQFSYIRYQPGDFGSTGFEPDMFDHVISVCADFMYAEDEEEVYRQAKELRRILSPTGEAWVVVDPAFVGRDEHEKMLRRTTEPAIWIQSPSRVNQHERVNIYDVLQGSGLDVVSRIIPRGGTMIDDEVTLVVRKG